MGRACNDALAMMGVYEQRDMAMAADLFAWIYRRSISKYGVMREAMGVGPCSPAVPGTFWGDGNMLDAPGSD
ncbi:MULTISPECIES: hypothetical protein [unclassified Pseudomonas]|uniref:hypothetical protein n=1 Tax=unclassified Pseudomonas TaxID=196821 RepID=UPI00381BF9AE